ncbi:MAG: multi-sensor signal transduction histidine kinase [Acidobacteria bacterium OLB17]|nr:MAG: multi-sensor signal transduction histidine kinase [Acidobacteria bacterium OLB17]MCZ2390740.1 PAS domain-containing protein [Acidobacteriota bacterium]
MLAAQRPKRSSKPSNPTLSAEDAGDLRFIADLGRSLLLTVHPKKVADRVVEAICEGTGATACVFAAELPSIGLIASSSAPSVHLERRRFESWMSLLPPQVGYVERRSAEFMLSGTDAAVEYVSPLRIEGDIHGAIIASFTDGTELTESRMRLLDAITQVAAMSVNLSAHYESTINSSIDRARQEHRKFTEAVLDALPVSLYVVDRDYKIVTWNHHREIGEQGIPRDAAVGRDIFSVLAKYPQERLKREFERAFNTGKIERIEQQTVEDDGTTRHWMVSKIPMRNAESGEITHVITVGEDITVRVDAMNAVSRAEKLAAVGRLAAGVVHEINNPLATVAACAEALEKRVEEGDFGSDLAAEDLREYLGLIKSETFRCKTITTGLLDFSRVRTGTREEMDVVDIVRSAANLISHQKRGNAIEITVEAGAEIARISGDGGQIQQAVIALATNAIDAMPNGGKLKFCVRQDPRRVIIEVSDTGIGIPTEDLPRIFEPFFTTKEVGKGTGLGLAVCYGIVSEHSGRISVRSSPSKGTTFTISLPLQAPIGNVQTISR